MTDSQQALLSLSLAADACRAALASLNHPQGSDLPDGREVPALPVLHKDLISLLSFVYSGATKLAIALKPSKPTYSASIAVLKDLSSHVLALSANVHMFDEGLHGATLIKEAKDIVRDVIEAVIGLIQAFVRANSSDVGITGDEYLVKTGTLHDLVERARGPNGISKDNVAAVRKKWQEDRKTLEDALKEVNEMIEDAESGDGEGDDFDDFEDENDAEWAELGLGSFKMTVEELARTKAVQPLLRVTTLLHKRILLDFLGGTHETASPAPNTSLDALLSHSASLLAAFDDVIATIYAPQKPSSIPPAIRALTNVLAAFNRSVRELLPPEDVETKLAETDAKKGKGVPSSKWYDAFFAQVDKLAKSATDSASNGTG